MLYRKVLNTKPVAPVNNISAINSLLFKGKSFVITGTFSYSRSEMEHFITTYGGSVKSSVTNMITGVFVGSRGHGTIKQKQATSLNRPQLTELDFNKMLNASKKDYEERQKAQRLQNALKGKTFVLTGKLSEARAVVENRIKAAGGYISSKVSSSTDFLLMGDRGTGTVKYSDAQRYNTRMITESEFNQMLS